MPPLRSLYIMHRELGQQGSTTKLVVMIIMVHVAGFLTVPRKTSYQWRNGTLKCPQVLPLIKQRFGMPKFWYTRVMFLQPKYVLWYVCNTILRFLMQYMHFTVGREDITLTS